MKYTLLRLEKQQVSYKDHTTYTKPKYMSMLSTVDYVRDLFYNAPIPIAYLEPNGTFRKVNLAWATFAGFSEADLVDRMRVHEITHPMDLEANIKMMQKVTLHHKVQPSYVSVSRYLSKDGKALWGQSYVSSIADDKGDVRMLLLFILPLPNHGNFKVIQEPAGSIPAATTVALRPSITFVDFIKDNWQWAIAISGTITAFFIKMLFVIADILQRVGLDWNEVIF